MLNQSLAEFKLLSIKDDLILFLDLCRQTYLETYNSGAQPEFSLEDVNERLFGKAYLAQLQDELESPQVEYILALVEGKVAGYAKLLDKEKEKLELDKFYFLKQYQGQSYGTQLFAKCCEQANSRGKTSIYWYVNMKNNQAIQFYKRLGAQIIGERDLFFIDHYNPNYMMEFKLK